MFQRLGGRWSPSRPLVQTVDPENRPSSFFQDRRGKGPDALVFGGFSDGPLALRWRMRKRKALGVTTGVPGSGCCRRIASGSVCVPGNSWYGAAGAWSAWSGFQERFLAERGQTLTLLAASGYDTARMLTLASLAPSPVSVEGTRHPGLAGP